MSTPTRRWRSSNGVARTGLSIREFLRSVHEAGVDSLPGTAAEILDDDVRWILTKGKLPTGRWIEVVTTAHSLGMPTTSTMMYGHVDHPGHWVAHLPTLARIQAETGGFTEFVPLPFVHQSSPIYLAGVARPGPTVRDNRAVHAVGRIMLPGLIDNIQCGVGQARARAAPRSSAEVSTIWAALSWRRPSLGWPAPRTVPARSRRTRSHGHQGWPTRLPTHHDLHADAGMTRTQVGQAEPGTDLVPRAQRVPV